MPFEHFLLAVIIGGPGLAAASLAVSTWFGASWSERAIQNLVALAMTLASAAALGLLIIMMVSGVHEVSAPMGAWFSVGHYEFSWVLVADRLSVPFAIFVALLTGLIGVFSRRYLHRESGFFRFYLLLSLFAFGTELVVLAGSLDLVFVGWELVGLSSALLIAFFHERPKPAEHGLRAFFTYRFCDIGLLAAAVWLHHVVGSAAFVESVPWAGVPNPGDDSALLIIGLLIAWASMGKAALFPLGGWLPRAMEGPTPSSAIFYGAISIHLGPYLLLRAASLIESSRIVAGAVILLGTATALHATLVGRTQSDIKSALAYASMTQVGIIVAEIGFGLRFIALAHIVGHAALRTMQILRSPSLLHDHHHLEQAVGQMLPHTGMHLSRLLPGSLQTWLYGQALNRGHADVLLRHRIVAFLLWLARRLDAIDRFWTSLLGGGSRAERDLAQSVEPQRRGSR